MSDIVHIPVRGSARSWNLLYSCAGAVFGTLALKRIGAPVFIVGTGRCGTSLLVDILSSARSVNVFPGEALELFHPSLYPYSARTIKSPPYWENPRLFTERSIQSWPKGYERKIRRVLLGQHVIVGLKRHLVVKSTMVNHMLPVLLKLFPDMRLIHVVRHGIPFMNSFVRKEQTKYGMDQEVDLFKEAISRYWNDCIREVENNKTLIRAGRFLEVRYEDLCADPVTTMAVMGRFIGRGAGGFQYDVNVIKNKNDKSGPLNGSEYERYLDVMREGLELKEYL